MKSRSQLDQLDALRQLNLDYINAVAASDVECFDQRLLARDFLNTNPDGAIVDREGFLAQIGKPSTVKDLKCEDVRIRLFGDFAVIHARTTYIKPDGQAGAGQYTDVWAMQDDRWLCVAAHVTRN